MKQFLKEFKTFALKGNVVDMAIGILIGTAFNNVVNSVVNDIFSPIIGTLVSNVNFSDLQIVLKQTADSTIAINIGTFVQTIINFVIVAFIAFMVVKTMNRIRNTLNKEEKQTQTEEMISVEASELKRIRELLENQIQD